jgi:hypothetical protein
MGHEGTVNGRDRLHCGSRIADCGFPTSPGFVRTGRIADLTARNVKNAERGHFGGTPKWAGEPPALPVTFSVFALFVFFVVKGSFMRWRMSDFFTCENGGAFLLFSLFAPVESLPNQYEFGCPWNAVFGSFLRLFAANQHNLLAINNLQPKMSISIKVN